MVRAALTVRQPWAHAIAHYGKHVENRTWRPPVDPGDWIAIHAAARTAPRGFVHLERLGIRIDDGEYHCSALIAVARLGQVVTERRDLDPRLHHWWEGPIGWVLDRVIPLHEPIPASGRLGLWTLDTNQRRRIASQIR